MKICSTCKEAKPYEDFPKSKNRKDGYNPVCKGCNKVWREENKEKLRESKREYYFRDHEAMKQKLRDRYADDPKKVIDAQRKAYSTLEGRKRRILVKAKESAKFRGLEFNIELEDIEIPTHCPYLGIELTHALGKGQLKSNSSIDRIDSTKGYVKGNIQIISRQANTMKNDATNEQLIQFAKSILSTFGIQQE